MYVLYCDLLAASSAAGPSEHLCRSRVWDCGTSSTNQGAVAACSDTTGQNNACQTMPFVIQ